MTLSRREFLGVAGGVVALPWLEACSETVGPPAAEPRLAARPGSPVLDPVAGRTVIDAATSTAFVQAPASMAGPAGVIVCLHGANRGAIALLDAHLERGSDEAGLILVAPMASGGGTWDAIHRKFSTDTAVIDAALEWVFRRWAVDPERIVMSGFSDGATYSLAIGRANGDLFARVIAYSPGFLINVVPVERPPILITHGTQDAVLPIGETSRRIVPALRGAGYTVDYREFAGPHAVPGDVLAEVIETT